MRGKSAGAKCFPNIHIVFMLLFAFYPLALTQNHWAEGMWREACIIDNSVCRYTNHTMAFSMVEEAELTRHKWNLDSQHYYYVLNRVPASTNGAPARSGCTKSRKRGRRNPSRHRTESAVSVRLCCITTISGGGEHPRGRTLPCKWSWRCRCASTVL
ncbi:hypothetical protein BD414DRAFT_483382 [Trametes punicea]|nr:hypothetical protein BD414DRAFT_483382 [Trametes punicea]